MQLTVNSEAKDYPFEKVSVSKVLEEEKVESPDMVAVQVNGSFVEKTEFDSLYLQEGDNVDFLYFMGGGA